LGNTPISNAYLKEEELLGMEPFFPLDVYVCPSCFLVQISEYRKADQIFSQDYAYYSSYSTSWLAHCRSYVDQMIGRFGYDKSSFILEIGSNDGYLLQYFVERGIPVLGVEPSGGVASSAIQRGVPTEITFFTEEYANKLQDNGKKADLIIGNNVLAHNPDINDFVAGLKIALADKGIITLEFPHFLQLFEKNQFDTIYHEHYSYLSLGPVCTLFRKHGLKLFDVDELTTHGGSLRIYVSHADAGYVVSDDVKELLGKEKRAGLYETETYQLFAQRVYRTKRNILSLLIDLKNNGKKVAGYGAPAKGNTLLNYCGIRSDFLEYVVDINPRKQGKYLPGTHLPIFSPEKIKADKPDYILILPWNIKDEIMRQCEFIREWGGKFIIPIPEPEVV
jgi:SAM-dependent methyltransferase